MAVLVEEERNFETRLNAVSTAHETLVAEAKLSGCPALPDSADSESLVVSGVLYYLCDTAVALQECL